MRDYEYLPLENEASIRLLTIFPGQFDDPIRAEIRHELLIPPDEIGHTRLSVKEISRTLPRSWRVHETLEGRLLFRHYKTKRTSWTHPDPDVDPALYHSSLDDITDPSVPVYEALSYEWGSPEKDETIEIEVSIVMDENMSHNNSACRHLPITSNLAVALRHVRFHDRPRTLWIDAVCIDQSNSQERSAQVQRMGEIFSLANSVVAWLGPSFTGSRLALNTLRRIGERLEVSNTIYIFPSPQCFGQDGQVMFAQLPTMDELDTIAQLCKVPYFARLWVVQELVLASAKSVVKCGDDGVPWPFFRRAMLHIVSWRDSIPDQRYRAISPVINICSSPPAISLPTLLYNHHYRGCADARDKVYACMNLLDPAVRKHIVADYSKSTLDVFKEVFLGFLGREERLAQLPYAGNCTLPASAWPTWLPDWSNHVSTIMSFAHRVSSISAAGAKYIAPNKLQVHGFSFAQISITGGQVTSGDGFSGVVKFLEDLGLEDLQTSNYPNGETLLDAYIQTIFLGLLDERYFGFGYPTLSQIRDTLTKLKDYDGNVDRSIQLDIHVTRTASAGKMFTTSNGYLGKTTSPIQPGDDVFIILGCDGPMILRPTSAGEYEIVGDCYLHSVMDGEALLGALPHPWKVKLLNDERGFRIPKFYNSDSIEIREYDPRLDSIPILAEWELIEFQWTREDPNTCRKFRNKATGEIINSDPRLFPEALLERGILVKSITLV